MYRTRFGAWPRLRAKASGSCSNSRAILARFAPEGRVLAGAGAICSAVPPNREAEELGAREGSLSPPGLAAIELDAPTEAKISSATLVIKNSFIGRGARERITMDIFLPSASNVFAGGLRRHPRRSRSYRRGSMRVGYSAVG